MKITFKDVGQGDSIILEWEKEGHEKIGIIDCNRKKDKTNPVLEYIKASQYTEIEFMILSHPHGDHFSGMVELLNYTESSGIVIKRFGHTLFILGTDFFKYLSSVEIDYEAMVDLRSLIDKVSLMRSTGLILKMDSIGEDWRLDLNENTYLKCLSPGQLEAEKYQDIVNFEPGKKKKQPAAQQIIYQHYSSSSIKIIIFYLLLTVKYLHLSG